MSVGPTSRHRGSSHTDHVELSVANDTTSTSHAKEISFLGKFVVVAGTTIGAGAGALAGGYLAVFGSKHCENTVRSYTLDHMYLGYDYRPWHGNSVEEESSAVGSICAIRGASIGASLGAAAGCWISMQVARRFF